MWDFSFSRAIGMVMQTLPFIVLRIIVYAGVALTYVFTVGIGGALGWGFGHIGASTDAPASGAFWGGAIGFGLVSGVLYFAREYLLYLVKAAHIAVLVELYDGHNVPAGQSQIGYGANFVKTHFAEASVLFGVDQLIKAVLRSLFNTINFFTAFLPIPALQSLIRLAEAFVRMSLTYVDEIILAYLIRTRTHESVGHCARRSGSLRAELYALPQERGLAFRHDVGADIRIVRRLSGAGSGVHDARTFQLFDLGIRVRGRVRRRHQEGDHGADRHRSPDAGLFQGDRGPDAECRMDRQAGTGLRQVP